MLVRPHPSFWLRFPQLREEEAEGQGTVIDSGV